MRACFVTLLMLFIGLRPVAAEEPAWLEISAYLMTGQPPEVLRLIDAADVSGLDPTLQCELVQGGAYFSLLMGRPEAASRYLQASRKLLDGECSAPPAVYLQLTLEQALAHSLDPGQSRLSLQTSWARARQALTEYRPDPGQGVVLHPHVLGASFALWLDQMVEAELYLGAQQTVLLDQVQSLGRSTAQAWASPQSESPNAAVYLAYLEAMGEVLGGLSSQDPLTLKLSLEPDFAKLRELTEAVNPAAHIEGASNQQIASAFLDRITATHRLRDLERLNEGAAGRKFDDAESARMRELMALLPDLVSEGAHVRNAVRYYVVGVETALHSQRTGWEPAIRALLEDLPGSLADYPDLHARALVVRSRLRRLEGRAKEARADGLQALRRYEEIARGGLGQGGLLRLRRHALPAFEAVVEASLADGDVESAFGAAWTFLALESQVGLPRTDGDLFVAQSSAQVKKKLLPDQRFLLYFPGEHRLIAFTLDQQGLAWSSSDLSRKELNDGQRTLRRALGLPGGVRTLKNTSWKGDQAAATLLDGMPRGDFKELIIGAPGSLVNYPWSYLLASSKRFGGKPPTFLLSDLNGQPPTAGIKSRSLRALGNPDGTLPAAELEVESLVKLVPNATVAVGKEANRAFLAGFKGGILHLATHGTIDPRLPSASSLLLAGPDQLLASEIANMKLPQTGTELVVLSACNSGSHVLDETGLRSLSGAFLQGGAPCVLGTLWAVNDEATSVLMKRFYQELEAGHPPQRALLLAQTELRESEQHRDPNFWAPFALYSR